MGVLTSRRLHNGLNLVIVEHHSRPIVSVSLLFPRGSLSDAPFQDGQTSLALHLATDSYETSGTEEHRVAENESLHKEFLSLGASVEARVSHDASLLSVHGVADDLPKYLKLLGVAVQDPRKGKDSFAARRRAMLSAIEDEDSFEPQVLHRLVMQTAFGRRSHYSISPYGTQDSLKTMNRSDLFRRQDQLLVPEGATLVVVGDVKPAAVVRQVEASFGSWHGKQLIDPPSEDRATDFNEPADHRAQLLGRPGQEALLVCSTARLPSASFAPAQEVLAATLGGSGGRLPRALREETGMAYVAYASIERMRLAQVFLACSEVRADQAPAGLRIFRQTLQSLLRQGPGEEELAAAKGQLIGQREAAYDSVLSTAGTWIAALELGQPAPQMRREIAAISSVTSQQVRDAARKLLREGALRWVLAGDPAAAKRAASANNLGLWVEKRTRPRAAANSASDATAPR